MTEVEVLYFVEVLAFLVRELKDVELLSGVGLRKATHPSMFDLQASVLQPHSQLFG